MLTIILVVLLFYLTYDSLSKAFGLWIKETAAMEREAYQSLPGGATEMSATAKGSGAPAVSASAVNISTEIVEENMGVGSHTCRRPLHCAADCKARRKQLAKLDDAPHLHASRDVGVCGEPDPRLS